MRKLHTLAALVVMSAIAALVVMSAISAIPVLAENVQYSSNPQNLDDMVYQSGQAMPGQTAPTGQGATPVDRYRGYTKSSESGSAAFEGTATTVPAPTEQAQGMTSIYRGYTKSSEFESQSLAFEGTAITVPAPRSLLDESTEIAKEKLDRAGM